MKATRFYGPPRTDFGPPPAGYIPGIGRGAVGFTTRSDIGPAAAVGVTTAIATSDDPGKLNDSNYDPFSGYNEQLFTSGIYDAEDKEADIIYDAIDRHMVDRKRKRKARPTGNGNDEHKHSVEKKENRVEVHNHFVDIKQSLAKVSEDEWLNIPDALDYSRHNAVAKAARMRDKITPAPDSLLLSSLANATAGTVRGSSINEVPMGDESESTQQNSNAHQTTDLTSIGRARDRMLSLKLDRMAADGAQQGQAIVDPTGYLSSLSSLNSDAQVSDIKKARSLLKSVVSTNPSYAPGWVALARFEKDLGKLTSARMCILKACDACPNDSDVWLEAINLHAGTETKVILAKALQKLPSSVNIWLKAVELENEVDNKRIVVRRALELVPTSVELWKCVLKLSPPNEFRALLTQAVEFIPQAVDMWLELARLETYENAKIVLNRARRALPNDPSIWVAAAKLEEANQHYERIETIIFKSISALSKLEHRVTRQTWLREAEKAEQDESLYTMAAIVKAVLPTDVSEEEKEAKWLEEAKLYEETGFINISRAIYNELLQHFPNRYSICLAAVLFEQRNSNGDEYIKMLQHSTSQCPGHDTFWLMLAKYQWRHDGVDAARRTLITAQSAIPTNEELWLAAVKIDLEEMNLERAVVLLSKARTMAKTPRLWLRSAKVERIIQNYGTPFSTNFQFSSFSIPVLLFSRLPILHDISAPSSISVKLESKDSQELSLLEEGVKLFPTNPKLWQMLAQYHLRTGRTGIARKTFNSGLEHCPRYVPLWLGLANLELHLPDHGTTRTSDQKSSKGSFSLVDILDYNSNNNNVGKYFSASQISRARVILENAKMKSPQDPIVSLEMIRFETLFASSSSSITALISKSIQTYPKAGILFAHAIITDHRTYRKSRVVEALKRCPDDFHVLLAIARTFWSDRKHQKAREWFDRAVKANPDWGDSYAYWLRMEVVCSITQFLANEQCSLEEYLNENLPPVPVIHGTNLAQIKQESPQETFVSIRKESASVKLQNYLVSQNTITAVIQACMKAEPRHGDLWTAVSKNDMCFAFSLTTILVHVTKGIREIMPGEAIQLPFLLSSPYVLK